MSYKTVSLEQMVDDIVASEDPTQREVFGDDLKWRLKTLSPDGVQVAYNAGYAAAQKEIDHYKTEGERLSLLCKQHSVEIERHKKMYLDAVCPLEEGE